MAANRVPHTSPPLLDDRRRRRGGAHHRPENSTAAGERVAGVAVLSEFGSLAGFSAASGTVMYLAGILTSTGAALGKMSPTPSCPSLQGAFRKLPQPETSEPKLHSWTSLLFPAGRIAAGDRRGTHVGFRGQGSCIARVLT